MPAGYVLKPPFRPLLNDKAIEFLESIVKPDWFVFEYGSGGSTLWLHEKTGRVYGVESDPDWFNAVLDLCAVQSVAIGGIYEIALIEAKEQIGSQEYANHITEWPNNHFDLVFVDGAARPLCIRESRAKVKPGGWMVVDDVQWNPVKNALHLLDDWEMVARFKGSVLGAADSYPRTNTTAFYRKPA